MTTPTRGFARSPHILGLAVLGLTIAVILLQSNLSRISLGATLVCAGSLALSIIATVHLMTVSEPTGQLLKRVDRLRDGEELVSLSKGLRGEAKILAERFEEVLHRVEKVSQTDSLTGLSNRRSFRQAFEREFERARRYGRPLALAIADVDYLKAANDAMGHQAGDEVLKIFSEAISRNVRSPDTAARTGGDEFAILMPETTAAEAVAMADRIRTCFAQKSIERGELKMSLTISVGVVDLDADSIQTPADVIGLADRALYMAKRQGRNRTICADRLGEYEGTGDAKDRPKISSIHAHLAGLDTEFKSLFVEAIGGLTSAMEARDKHTVNHSAKVCRYAMMIARQMNLPESTVEHVGQAAILHNIGKISLPDSILLKEGDLTEEEWHLLRQHPEMSARIIMAMGFLDREIPAVRCHHERYDGSGYPQGLSGSAIPLEARILAVADAFDAMTSSRAYRKRIAVTDALEEIRRYSGSYFDPVVANAFLEVAQGSQVNDVIAAEAARNDQAGDIVATTEVAVAQAD